MKYYKLLFGNKDGYSGFEWDLSGEWMTFKGKNEMEMCKNGFHILDRESIIYWLECGFDLYEVAFIGTEDVVIPEMLTKTGYNTEEIY